MPVIVHKLNSVNVLSIDTPEVFISWRTKAGRPIPIGKVEWSPKKRAAFHKKKIMELSWEKRSAKGKDAKDSIEKELTMRKKALERLEALPKPGAGRKQITIEKPLTKQSMEGFTEKFDMVHHKGFEVWTSEGKDSKVHARAISEVIDGLPRTASGELKHGKDFKDYKFIVSTNPSQNVAGIRDKYGKDARSLAGFNSLAEGEIVIFADTVKGFKRGKYAGISKRDKIKTIAFHEAGHSYSFGRMDKGWKKIHETSKKSISTYGKTSSIEDFAETFAYAKMGKLSKREHPERVKALNEYFDTDEFQEIRILSEKKKKVTIKKWYFDKDGNPVSKEKAVGLVIHHYKGGKLIEEAMFDLTL